MQKPKQIDLLRIVTEEVHRAFRLGMRSLSFNDAVQEVCGDVLRIFRTKGLSVEGNGGLVRAVARSQVSRAQRFAAPRLRPVECLDMDGPLAFEEAEDETSQVFRVRATDPREALERSLSADQALTRYRAATAAFVSAAPAATKSRQAEAQALSRAAAWLKKNRRPFDISPEVP
jgi:hypothetical protein